MSTLVTGIAELVTNDAAVGAGPLGLVADAAVVVEDGVVAWVGPRATPRPTPTPGSTSGGRAVIPGFVDSHAHLVFAGDRAAEFEARMSGERYDGGGIASTVAATRAASDETAARAAARRSSREMRAQGTTTVEVKSGYGLTVEDEARALRLAAEVTPETTFLGAHVVPAEYSGRVDDYVGLVTGPMLAACAPHARWIDVFCEPASAHAFDGDAARAVLEAGRAAGLELRVHANQLSAGPGVRLAVELGAASADHCTHLTDADVDALAGGLDGRDAAAGGRVLHPLAVSRRPAAAGGGGDGGAGDRLQPGQLLHLVDGVLRRAGGARDGDDAGRGAVGGDRRRARPRSAASDVGHLAPGRARRPRRPRRAVLPAPGLPAGRAAGPHPGAAGELSGQPPAASPRSRSRSSANSRDMVVSVRRSTSWVPPSSTVTV